MSVPKRCIWCLEEKDESSFDISHVVPECVGNESQILPKGIVCKKCNNYFGTKVEPYLLSDPLFHIIAVFLRLQDPEDMNEFRDRVWDSTHPPSGSVTRNMSLDATISPDSFNLDLQYTVGGQISKTYKRREKAFLSRAVHKIAFESLAWVIFVKKVDTQLDIFDSDFNHVREWVRYGNPISIIRPVLRNQRFARINNKWECMHWKFPEFIGIELNLFGDWYIVNLTSPPDRVEVDLRKRVDPSKHKDPIWLIGEKFTQVS